MHKFDEAFNKIDSLIITPSEYEIYEGAHYPIIANNNNLIISTSNYNYNTDSFFISLTCLDKYLDTLWTKNYLNDTFIKSAYTVIKTFDNGFAISGATYTETNDIDAYLIKTDSLGNKEWERFYGYSNSDGAFCMIQTPDSGFMLAGDSRKYDMYRSDWYIIRIDSLGNQVWDWIIQNPGFDDGYINDLIQTQDGNFIAVGGKTYGSDYVDNFSYSRLLKFDDEKNTIIDTLYLEPYYNDDSPEYLFESMFLKIKEIENGNLLVINMTSDLPERFSSFPKLYELSKNGILLKKRSFHSVTIGIPYYDCLLDLVIEPEGVIMCGFSSHSGIYNPHPATQNIWIVKTNLDYCDNWGSCDTTYHVEFLNLPDTINRSNEFDLQMQLFGNRAEFLYNVNLKVRTTDSLIHTVQFANIELSTICHYIIDYDSLVAFNNGIAIDSVFVSYSTNYSDSVSGYSDYSCPWYTNKIVFTDTYNVNELSIPNLTLKVYPNPVNDILQIEYISLTGSGTINIYDLQGRKQISIPIKDKMGFEQVDVSSLPTGTYIVTDGELGSKNSIKMNVQH